MNYWATTRWGTSSPTPLREREGAHGRRARVKMMVRAAARGRPRSDSRRVYNHTAEGGPSRAHALAARHRQRLVLSPRAGRPAATTGFHRMRNTLNMRHPRVLQAHHGQPALLGRRHARRRLSLRPGERAGARAVTRSTSWARSSTSSSRIPCCRRWKLIAEPWDLGEGGYQVGNFRPAGPSERPLPRLPCASSGAAMAGRCRQLASRLAGSSDLYAQGGRRPYASINFVTSHDGFTLRDWSATTRSTTRPTGEGNRDGKSTTQLELRRRRPHRRPRRPRAAARARCALLATLLPFPGVPMLTAGDEIERTSTEQQRVLPGQRDQLDQLGTHPGATRPARLHAAPDQLPRDTSRAAAANVFQGRAPQARTSPTSSVDADGQEMTDATWNAPHARCLGAMLVGDAIAEVDERGEPIHDDTLCDSLERRRIGVRSRCRRSSQGPGVGAGARHERRRADCECRRDRAGVRLRGRPLPRSARLS